MKALLAAAVLFVAGQTTATASPLKVVAYDIQPFELVPTAELRELLANESAVLRRALADTGLVVLGATACDDCGRTLGADLVVETTIQEIQYPSYNIAATVRDVATNRVLRRAVVGVEGLEAEDWDRGVQTLVKERLLARPLPSDVDGLREMVARVPAPVE